MSTPLHRLSVRTASHVLSALAIASGIGAALYLLVATSLGDAFFAGWVLFSVGLTIVGGIGTWTNRTPLVWLAALLLVSLTIVGMWSIGFVLVPAAVFLLGAAVCSHRVGPRRDVHDAIVSNPPTVQKMLRKAATGAGMIVFGSWLVYDAAIEEELFGACARETMRCAVETTNWGAVVITTFGVLAICLGGWLTWRQTYIARIR